MKRAAIAMVPFTLVVLALAAPLLANSPLLAFSIRRFFALVCHQDPARSFWLAGAPVAICVRCLGIYLGGALGACISISRKLALRACAALVALNALDVVAEWAGLHGNLPLPRFLLGLSVGVAAGALVASLATETAALKLRRRPALPL